MKWLEHTIWTHRAMGTPIKQLYLDLPGAIPNVPYIRKRRPSGVRRVRNEFVSLSLPTLEKTREDRLRRLLQSYLKTPVNLILTDNISNMLHVITKDGEYFIRLHRMFLESDAKTIWFLSKFISTGENKYRKAIMDFIESYSYLIKRKPTSLKTQGEHFDLKEIFDYLNQKYFDNKIKASITWGQKISSTPRHHKSVRLGTYNSTTKTITIHTLLDRDFVPRFFIEFVVYHEMLHAFVGKERRGDRVFHHTELFRSQESLFEEYEKARQWEQENKIKLLYF